MDKILIDYGNYIINDNNQIDVVFYKSGDDDIIVETTCTKTSCPYRGVMKFSTIVEGRKFFDNHVKQIIDDDRILSFGTLNPFWFTKWPWIKTHDGRPIISIVEPTTIECGSVIYNFNFDDKGNIDRQHTMVVDRRFCFDHVALIVAFDIAGLRLHYHDKSFVDRFLINRQLTKMYSLIKGHVFVCDRLGIQGNHKPMRDCELITNGVVSDILTFNSLQAMIINCCNMIDDSRQYMIK